MGTVVAVSSLEMATIPLLTPCGKSSSLSDYCLAISLVAASSGSCVKGLKIKMKFLLR